MQIAFLPVVPVDTLRARTFQVIDRAGNPRAAFGLLDEGVVGMILTDTNGKHRAQLTVAETGPTLCLASENPQQGDSIWLTLWEDEGPRLSFERGLFNRLVKLTLDTNGTSGIYFAHSDGTQRASRFIAQLRKDHYQELSLRCPTRVC